MKVFICMAVVLLSVASGSRHGKPEYYWRDFDGMIPEDALKVAQNGSEYPVYIGQGYFEGVGILPGLLEHRKMEMKAVANGQVYTITHNIQVLATTSKNPSTDFPWVSIHYDNLHNLRNLHFLRLPLGGTESHSDVFIGRHSEPGYIDIGKVYTVEPYQGLTVMNAEGKPTIYKNFEVLAMLNFECDDEENESSPKDSNENFHRTKKNNQETNRRTSTGSNWRF